MKEDTRLVLDMLNVCKFVDPEDVVDCLGAMTLVVGCMEWSEVVCAMRKVCRPLYKSRQDIGFTRDKSKDARCFCGTTVMARCHLSMPAQESSVLV